MYQLTKDPNIVVRIEDGTAIPLSDPDGAAQRDYAAWLAAGNTPQPAPAMTIQELQQGVVSKIQERLDDFAKTRGYDNVNSISKYQNISDAEIAALPSALQASVTKFRAECRSLAVQTAATWAACYTGLAAVQSGQQPMPATVDAAIAQLQLPPLAWPAGS